MYGSTPNNNSYQTPPFGGPSGQNGDVYSESMMRLKQSKLNDMDNSSVQRIMEVLGQQQVQLRQSGIKESVKSIYHPSNQNVLTLETGTPIKQIDPSNEFFTPFEQNSNPSPIVKSNYNNNVNQQPAALYSNIKQVDPPVASNYFNTNTVAQNEMKNLEKQFNSQVNIQQKPQQAPAQTAALSSTKQKQQAKSEVMKLCEQTKSLMKSNQNEAVKKHLSDAIRILEEIHV